MQAKNYITGSAREKTFDNGGSVINLSICLDDLLKLPKTQDKSGRAYVKLTIAPRKTEGKYGETHAIYEDTYQPKPKEGSTTEPKIDPNDLPF